VSTQQFSNENPVRHGQRDTDIAMRMSDEMGDPGEQDTAETGLMVGDSVIYKVVVQDQDPVTRNDRWFTLGYQTTVGMTESEDDTFTRVVSGVHERIDQAIEHKDGLAIQKANNNRARQGRQ
jgi:hypothetical protein